MTSGPCSNGHSETPRTVDDAPALVSGPRAHSGRDESSHDKSGTEGATIDSEAQNGLELTDPRTLEMLVCPLTKATLEYDGAHHELISRRANLAYPLRCGVPLLTREAARSLDR